MKKKLFISIGIIILIGTGFWLLLSFNKKDGTLLCTSTINSNGVLIKNKYEVVYKSFYAVSVVSSEDITAEDEEVLEQYKNFLESMYQPYSEIEYYSNEIKVNGNNLSSVTKINYDKISKEDLVAVDRDNASLYDNDKVPIQKLRKVYKDMGARCRNS